MKIKASYLRLFVISIIFILGLFLRLVNIQDVPPGFNADEAALGYNAYSVLNTGKDEWGEAFPLTFKSFSDYKPGLYVYLDIPFVWLLGLNELAVRLPSIILGSFSVILIYFLSKQFFKNELIALSSAFLLAISPWHLHFSRGAWETNIATFFMLLGIFAFIKGVEKQKWLYISALSMAFAMYSYQSQRLIIPVMAVFLILFYWKKLLVKKNMGVIIFAIIIIIPFISIMTSQTGLARFQGISIFSDVGPLNRINQLRGEDMDPNSFTAKFFHNKVIEYSDNFLSHYMDHFSFNFLFLNGDPLGRNKVPNTGQFYMFEIITILLGIYLLCRKRFSYIRILLVWILVAPVAASLTYQTPHALRAENMVIPLALLSGLGLGTLIEKIWQFKMGIKYISLFLFALIITFFVTSYLHNYYVHLPKEYALEWEHGFSKMVQYVLENQDKYQKVVITDRYDQAYILVLFYSKYDPAKYQQTEKTVGDNKFGFSTISAFDKYEFRPIAKEEIATNKDTLFIASKDEVNEDASQLKVINFPNVTPVFRIFGK
ncbi:MAG: glycosyltransferase family 39 protein [Candidatus Daviesbacteria bacterium]|nr:glycosyltransferase family 39 protein [Candidatus Daviesbacteria bacterium]